jgi:hypothetical protein
MHLEPAYILGTKRFDEERRQVPGKDKVHKELSHFCTLLRQSNSEALEVLFADAKRFLTMTPQMEMLRAFAMKFVDSTALFKCLRGYMQGERKLANGERKGQIGGKRYATLQKVGYSPKNAAQFLRLANVGIHFFNESRYIVDCADFGMNFHGMLLDIKMHPENTSKEYINQLFDDAEISLVEAYENRKHTYHFDEDLMNEILLEIYLPVLNKQ